MKAQENVDQLPTNCKQLIIKNYQEERDMNYAQKQAAARQAYLEIGMEVGM